MYCAFKSRGSSNQSGYLKRSNLSLRHGSDKKKTLRPIDLEQKCAAAKGALKSKVQLSPANQMAIFYDSVKKESKELDEKKEELQEKLEALAARREEVNRTRIKLKEYMKRKQPELESMQRGQNAAKRKADTEEKSTAKYKEDIIELEREYEELLEQSSKLKTEIDQRKHFKAFIEEACKKGFGQHSNWGHGYKSAGEIIVHRYQSLCHVKKEIMKKHQRDLEEIQRLSHELGEASEKHTAYVSMCQSKLASLQQVLDKHLCAEGKRQDISSKQQKRVADRCRVIDQSLRAIDNLYEKCVSRESSISSSLSGDSLLDQKLHDIKEYVLRLDGVASYCKEHYFA